VLQAMSVCVVKEIPFTLNMVVTAHNRHELEPMAQLASRLGSQGLRFGHLMPTPLAVQGGLDLSPWERKLVEAEIWRLRRAYSLPIALGPGSYTTDLFPCAALQMQELNVDCAGNLTWCCHLSGHGNGVGHGDVIVNLGEVRFAEAYRRLVHQNERFCREKRGRLSSNAWRDTDFHPCWYCSVYYGKVGWLKNVPDHPWACLVP
jgi:MoaA/NifB/PqqE/SkfB family radical SAM enzyme